MLKKRLVFYLTVVFFALLTLSLFAEVEDSGFENKQSIRFAPSASDDSLYLTRTNAFVDYRLPFLDKTIKIIPFFEYQHNLETNAWWRKELGTEFGACFFDDWFYYGASFQHIWQDEKNYPNESMEETTEWESRFVIIPNLPWEVFQNRLKLHLFDEYTYDFQRGQSTFNEVGVTLDWQVREWLIIPIGWRHIDRVHDYDCDFFEFSLLLKF